MDDDCQDVLVLPFGLEDMSPLVWKCDQLVLLLLQIFQQCTMHALNFFFLFGFFSLKCCVSLLSSLVFLWHHLEGLT